MPSRQERFSFTPSSPTASSRSGSSFSTESTSNSTRRCSSPFSATTRFSLAAFSSSSGLPPFLVGPARRAGRQTNPVVGPARRAGRSSPSSPPSPSASSPSALTGSAANCSPALRALTYPTRTSSRSSRPTPCHRAARPFRVHPRQCRHVHPALVPRHRLCLALRPHRHPPRAHGRAFHLQRRQSGLVPSLIPASTGP